MEDSRITDIVVIAAILAAIAICWAIVANPDSHPTTQAPQITVAGTVETSGPISMGRYSGGTRELARVRIDRGQVVNAFVVSGGPLLPGDRVILLERVTTVGPKRYSVISKSPR
jgi:hypothetical protein